MVPDMLWSAGESQGQGETPLYAAARGGYADVVRLLLEAGAKLDPAAVCT